MTVHQVLNDTSIPIFFIASQAVIAAELVLLTKWSGLVKYHTSFTDVEVVKSLWRIIVVNAASLLSV